MKIIVSSFGSLFFDKTCKCIASHVELKFIEGYVPSLNSARIIDFLYRKRKSLVLKNLLKRRDPLLQKYIKCCSFSELFYRVFGAIFGENDALMYYSHILFGRQSCKYINNADIFHVRSGSGRGGAIEKAQNEGMKVLVDHSIPHPHSMERVLKDEYSKYGKVFDLGGDSKFWNGVVKDCQAADYLLVNSDYVKKTFVDEGFNPNKIKVLYLGVREDFFSIKKSYEIEGEIKILFVGAFGFRKGCEYILKALKKLNSLNIKYKLFLIGSYAGFEDVLSSYDSLHIDFVGNVFYDDLKNYYSSCDIFLFPSLCEGCTRAGMEAMSAGIPVIVTENCGLPVQNNINGVIIPIKDKDEIVKAILKLSSSIELRRKIGMEAAKTIRDNYKMSDYTNNLLNYYMEILG